MKIGITGADGLIGWHVRAWLRVYRPDSEVRLATRHTFATDDALQQFASGLDAIVHCAGMNRGPDTEIESTNLNLARRLTHACETAAKSGVRYPTLVFTNSTHIRRDTAYGRGKQGAAKILGESAEHFGAKCANLILPHVYGEFGRPFYNSAVATFCYQLANGETPQVQVNGDLELVHTQTVAARCISAIEHGEQGEFPVTGAPLKVSELLDKLTSMADSYIRRNVVPDIRESLDLNLFNMLRSYRFPQYAQTPLMLHQDNRGSLFEAVKTDHGGQAFVSTTHPGIVRGNHFHTYKFERFLVCAGEAEIRLRRLFDDKVHIFHVSGDVPCFIDMPTFHTHSITNVSSRDVVTLFWASEIFDPAKPDTIAEKVLP